MATRDYVSAVQAAATNTTSATVWNDNTSVTLTSKTGDWLIMASGVTQVDNASSASSQVRLFNDTDAVSLDDGQMEMALATGVEWEPFFLMAIVALGGSPVTKTYSLEHKLTATGASRDSWVDNGSIVALKLTAADASVSDDANSASTANPGAWTSHATALTFTPGSTGDYLIVAKVKLDGANANGALRAALLLEDATTRVGEHEWSTTDATNSQPSEVWMVKRNLAASSQSFVLQHGRTAAGSNTSTMSNLRMVALRLDEFNGTAVTTEDTVRDTSTSATLVDLGDTATAPTSSDDWLVLANAEVDINATAVIAQGKFLFGSTTLLHAQFQHAATGRTTGHMIGAVFVEVAPAGETVKIQGAADGTNTVGVDEHRFYVLGLEAAGGTNANAGNASGTGAASGAATSVAPAGGHASGTGTANAGQASVAPPAGHAAGTGAAHDATVTRTGEPLPAAATGTGTATAPATSIAPSGGQAAGTGAAYDATVTTGGATNANAGNAAGTGAAYNPTISISVSAVLASATGVAYDPGGSIAPVATTATATATGYAPSISVAPSSGHASGTGAGYGTTALVSVGAAAATGTGTARDATTTGAQPDPNPIDITIRERAYTDSFTENHHPIVRERHLVEIR